MVLWYVFMEENIVFCFHSKWTRDIFSIKQPTAAAAIFWQNSWIFSTFVISQQQRFTLMLFLSVWANKTRQDKRREEKRLKPPTTFFSIEPSSGSDMTLTSEIECNCNDTRDSHPSISGNFFFTIFTCKWLNPALSELHWLGKSLIWTTISGCCQYRVPLTAISLMRQDLHFFNW